MRSGCWRRAVSTRARAVGRGQHREARVLEVVAGELDDLGFVVDDEDGSHGGHRRGVGETGAPPGMMPGGAWEEGEPVSRRAASTSAGWRSAGWSSGPSRRRGPGDASPRTCRGTSTRSGHDGRRGPSPGRPSRVRPSRRDDPAAPEDRPDQPEHDEQEEQREQEAEEPEAEAEGMPAVPVGGHDDRIDDGGAVGGGLGDRGVDACLIGGGGDDPAADREDGDQDDRGDDSHGSWCSLRGCSGIHLGSRLSPPSRRPCGVGVEARWRGCGASRTSVDSATLHCHNRRHVRRRPLLAHRTGRPGRGDAAHGPLLPLERPAAGRRPVRTRRQVRRGAPAIVCASSGGSSATTCRSPRSGDASTSSTTRPSAAWPRPRTPRRRPTRRSTTSDPSSRRRDRPRADRRSSPCRSSAAGPRPSQARAAQPASPNRSASTPARRPTRSSAPSGNASSSLPTSSSTSGDR